MTDSEKEEGQGTGFKVEDRRKFNAEGDPVLAGGGGQATPKRESAAGPGREREGSHSERPKEPSIDFASFIMSLAASAMAYLGEMPDPATGERMDNPEGAQQMIDILTMLKEKTEGNLEPDEAQLLESLLYELRMKYLSKRNLIRL